MRSASTGSPAVCSSLPRPEAPPPCAGRRAGQQSAGFTLVEVLVAMLILAIGLSALYPSFTAALNNIGNVDGYLGARQLAQSVLDEQTAARIVKRGVTRGRDGPFRWQLSIDLADDDVLPDQPNDPWKLHSMVVVVTWPLQRRLQLETLHLARSQ